MKITNEKIKKLIRVSLKKNLMEMPLRNLTIAQKNKDDLFNFSPNFPEDEASRSTFNPQLVADIKDTAYIRDYFRKSIVDIDVVILPEHLIRGITQSDYSEFSKYNVEDMNSIFSETKINAFFKGKHARYQQLIRKIMNSDYKNAITLIMQSHYKANLPFDQRSSSINNINNLSWGLHDALGHIVQWNASKGSLLYRDPDGDSEFVRSIEGGSSNEDNELLANFRSDILLFFKENNFTKEVDYNDAHASICAWFVMNGKLPDPFYNPIYKSLFPIELIAKFEKEIIEKIEQLKGKAIVINFMDR